MTTLTLQFLLVAILPLSLLGMLVYAWLRSPARPGVRKRWALTLLAAAVWASSVLRFYGGQSLSGMVVFGWGMVGRYALVLTTLGVLLTTTAYLAVPRVPGRIALAMSVIPLGLALLLDPALWGRTGPTFVIAGQTIRQFDVWAAVWIVAWLLPLVAAWLLTQQLRATLPYSVFRSQTDYWMLVLLLMVAAGALASIQQPGQPAWQELGILFAIAAALVGTINLTNSMLPDLQLVIRQSLGRLLMLGMAFALTWLLLLLVSRLASTPRPDLLIGLIAGLLVVLFTAVYPWANRVLQRQILTDPQPRSQPLVPALPPALGNAPEPTRLARLFLETVQAALGTDDAWILGAQDGPGGDLVLQPLAGIGMVLPQTAVFDAASPFVAHLRQRGSALLQVDLASQDTYAALDPQELTTLAGWQRVMFMALPAGTRLVGVLALGARHGGQAYDRQDLARLQELAAQMGPLLGQAQNLAVMRSVSDYVLRRNQTLARANQQLAAFSALQAQFIDLVGPDLKRPFPALYLELEKLSDGQPESEALLATLQTLLGQHETQIDRLINTAAQVQQQHGTEGEPVQMDEIARAAVRALHSMAEARRVTVAVNSASPLPAVLGERRQLQDAVYHLLHNAIKYNKVGGSVTLETGTTGNDVYVRVRDTGVGIPPERLESVWGGFSVPDTMTQRRDVQRRTGIGLTLTRYVARAHGGDVVVESKYGIGSTFTLLLPACFD